MLVANIVLIGTSHVAQQSVHAIDEAVDLHSPAVIAIELDPGRLHALMHPSKGKMRLRDVTHYGITGYLFSLVGAWAEKQLGNQVGTNPGADMLHAVKLARQRQIPLTLVDQDIGVTLKRLSKGVSWLERMRFAKDLVSGMFGKKQKLPFDLRTVPSDEVIEKLIKDVRQRYPNLYRVLVQERNEIMARRLAGIARRTDGKVLAVVGAGHVKDMAALIRRYLAQTI